MTLNKKSDRTFPEMVAELERRAAELCGVTLEMEKDAAFWPDVMGKAHIQRIKDEFSKNPGEWERQYLCQPVVCEVCAIPEPHSGHNFCPYCGKRLVHTK